MPLIIHETDSLPYLDPEPAPSALLAAQELIVSETNKVRGQYQHPSLPPLRPSLLGPALQHEHALLSAISSSTRPTTIFSPKDPSRTGIDTTRYHPPPPTSASITNPPSKQDLTQARINSTYVRLRNQQLNLLEQHGKEVWLGTNHTALEPILSTYERELAQTKAQIEAVSRERRARQTVGPGAGIPLLETQWRERVGAAVEVELALAGTQQPTSAK